ncbi:quinone-dependent dihydroorotate dehydrogenase [Dinghuibacter silviterrae]|uniref:Dihydroorotate dehydrogenase (quinone) n=1 Tax=Dinghuibacter silviterrae TaxID=1539049 RepID=A0A4R8DQU5_9BACT|nr:quinone-dependent dihydroorotate dehydrogenase [Dinghuibacter silviterrae]TDX00168.1 dihydroorotate oxidase A [Dinghuibacter silviterrae]
MMYALLRRILFNFSTESVHHFAMDVLRAADGIPPVHTWLSRAFAAELPRTAWGLTFRNPVGLGAGFDKNAVYLSELDALGFGFVEIGTVTPRPQPGNDKPRLFRLPPDKALINRMGFNNEGAEAAADRVRAWRERGGGTGHNALIVGGNIGKNKDTPNEDAEKDYTLCFKALQDCVDYFVVNVSSPNTPGLRALQEKDALLRILGNVQELNQGLAQPRPLLLKIAPDLTEGQLDDIIDLANTVRLSGLVATNTTISREGLSTPSATVTSIGAGGLSGAPLRARSTEVIRHIRERSGGDLPIIGSGGVFTAGDAREKFDAGALLVQVWTGFIYEGPGIVKKICKGL